MVTAGLSTVICFEKPTQICGGKTKSCCAVWFTQCSLRMDAGRETGPQKLLYTWRINHPVDQQNVDNPVESVENSRKTGGFIQISHFPGARRAKNLHLRPIFLQAIMVYYRKPSGFLTKTLSGRSLFCDLNHSEIAVESHTSPGENCRSAPQSCALFAASRRMDTEICPCRFQDSKRKGRNIFDHQ